MAAKAGSETWVSDERFIAELPGILAEFRLGVVPRVVAAVLTACLGLVWLPWWSAIIPTAAIVFHEFVLFPLMIRRAVLPNAAGRPASAVTAYRILILLGASAYATCWGFLFAIGETIPVFLGACWLWGAALHNQVYFSRRADLYFASLAPHLVVGLAVPFFAGLPWWGPLLMALGSVVTVGNFAIGYFHRRDLALHADADRTARAKAEEANIAKSQFLTTMSHELRTPLNAIIGYAEIIEEDHDGSDATTSADDARRVRRAARHLLSLINEVLDLSKIEAGRLEIINGPVDVAALLREIEETVRPIGAGNGNKVVLDIASRMPLLETDGARLKQCLLNLATNACKFTRDGRVTIRATVENRASGATLEITVCDTGIGISREDQAKLFRPFVQVDGAETRAQDGTGLGLVITRKLAQAMGGDVSLVSTPGIGSAFTLCLPARAIAGPRAPDRTPPATQAATDNDSAHTGAQVLVIEDDVAAHDLTCRALERLFMTVECVAHGEDGLARIAVAAPALVVLDINLPDISGWTVLERLKASPATRNIPVLVVTIDDDRARAMALGACDHMVKPVDRDSLLAAAMRYALRSASEAGGVAPPADDARRFG